MSASARTVPSGARLLSADEWQLVAARRLRTADAAPYLASLLLAMPVYAVAGITAGVDRSARLYLGMDFFRSLSDSEAVGLLLHEVRHIVHGHSDRAEAAGVQQHDRPTWNLAGDLTINDDLRTGGFELPQYAVLCDAFGVNPGKTVETYFDHLRNALPDESRDDQSQTAAGWRQLTSGAAHGCGSGAGGQTAPWEFNDAADTDDRGGDADGLGRGLTPLDLELQRRQVAGEVTRHVAKHGFGSVPAELARWADEFLRPPTVHWREFLRTAVRRPLQIAAGVDDYTWTRRNRRRQSGKIILPATFSVVPDVAVIVDTSGSISGEELSAFAAEIVGMVGQFRIQARDVPIVACDATAYPPVAADKVIRGEQLRGGGGTDMGAGLNAVAEFRQRPDLIVVFTDGYTPWPEHPPRSSVVVAICQNGSADSVPEWAAVVEIDDAVVR